MFLIYVYQCDKTTTEKRFASTFLYELSKNIHKIFHIDHLLRIMAKPCFCILMIIIHYNLLDLSVFLLLSTQKILCARFVSQLCYAHVASI